MKWKGGSAAGNITITATALFFTGPDSAALTPQTVTPSGGTLPYSFTGVGLPAGVSVNATTGVVSGTPTSSGNTTASVTVTDAASRTLSVPVFFAISVGSFSDTLLRSAGAQLGNPWVLGYSDPTIAGWYNTTGGIFCNNTTGLTIRNPSGGGSAQFMPIVPAVSSAWSGLTQFAEIKLIATAGASAFDMGPAVALSGDASTGTQNGYYCSIHFGATAFSIRQANVTNRLVTGNLGTWAINDVFRISVQFSAPSNTIIISQNGTVINTTVDNNATRPLSTNGGVPGIYYAGCATVNGETFQNYKCGLGT